jgi:spore coat polysaccharide biosynthesis protein SpsF
LKKSTLDYLSNTIVRTFPRGLDVEIFSRKALNQALKEAKTPSELEHVTPYFYHHPNLFRRGDFVDAQDESHYRLTVDTEEDFKLMKWIIEALYPRKKAFSYRDILDVLKEHPEWEKLNEHVKQKHL